LTRLNSPTTEAERRRVEFTLAVARILIVLALLIDPSEPLKNSSLLYPLFAAWFLHSALVLAWVSRRGVERRTLLLLHLADIFWPSLMLALSHGISTPFMMVYTFALLAAGFRWGFPEAVFTALAGAAVLEVDGISLALTSSVHMPLTRLLVRCAYLIALGSLVGILGENEKERRAEAAVVSRVIAAGRAERTLRSVLQAVFAEFLSIFGPAHLCIAAHELATDRVYLWQSSGQPHPANLPFVKELHGPERFAYMLPELPEAFFCRRTRGNRCRMIAPGMRSRISSVKEHLPPLPFIHPQSLTVMGIRAWMGREWQLQLILVDARLGRAEMRELDFATMLFERIAPAIYGIFLVRRLRSRASALERARVARELHDGAIQSLISTEMRCDILRRRAQKEAPALEAEIGSLRELLSIQVQEMRELMRQLKPIQVSPDQLISHLAEQVERFRRESGITAHFIAAEDEVQLTPHTCRELLLVQQEALVNIRKHANARDVLVTFGRQDGYWQLSVIDNGNGFGFEGTLTGAELMKSARGPAVIKERVANLGGELVLESKPYHGSHLLIKVPVEYRMAHAE
jgi:signal transduction histidine kinase